MAKFKPPVPENLAIGEGTKDEPVAGIPDDVNVSKEASSEADTGIKPVGQIIDELKAGEGVDPQDIGPQGVDLTGIPREEDGRPLNMRTRMDLLYHREQLKLREKILGKRNNPEPKPVPPKPSIAPAILKQTQAEMDMGKRQSEWHKSQQATRVYPAKKEPWEGTNTTIFRDPTAKALPPDPEAILRGPKVAGQSA